jgi:hypothetical protein
VAQHCMPMHGSWESGYEQAAADAGSP